MGFYYSEGNMLIYAQQLTETEYVLAKYTPNIVSMAYAESVIKKDPVLFIRMLDKDAQFETITTHDKQFAKRLREEDYIEEPVEIDVVFRNNLYLLTAEKCEQCINNKTCTLTRPTCNAAGMCKMFIDEKDICSSRHIDIMKNYVQEICNKSSSTKELRENLVNTGFKTVDMAMMGYHHVVAVEHLEINKSSFAFFDINEYEIESYTYMLKQAENCTTMLQSKGATDIHVEHLQNNDISITYFLNNEMNEIKISRTVMLLTRF